MLDTPEGNLALVALCLFILIAVVLILIGLFLLLQKAECVGFDRSVREEVYDAPKMLVHTALPLKFVVTKENA